MRHLSEAIRDATHAWSKLMWMHIREGSAAPARGEQPSQQPRALRFHDANARIDRRRTRSSTRPRAAPTPSPSRRRTSSSASPRPTAEASARAAAHFRVQPPPPPPLREPTLRARCHAGASARGERVAAARRTGRACSLRGATESYGPESLPVRPAVLWEAAHVQSSSRARRPAMSRIPARNAYDGPLSSAPLCPTHTA